MIIKNKAIYYLPIVSKLNRKELQFNSLLDVQYLQSFFNGDQEEALMAFYLFLNITANEFPLIYHAALREDWHEVHRLAHKMKPNFRLVGLTKLGDTLGEMEQLALNIPASPRLKILVKDFYCKMLDHYLPAVESQYESLKMINEIQAISIHQ